MAKVAVDVWLESSLKGKDAIISLIIAVSRNRLDEQVAFISRKVGGQTKQSVCRCVKRIEELEVRIFLHLGVLEGRALPHFMNATTEPMAAEGAFSIAFIIEL